MQIQKKTTQNRKLTKGSARSDLERLNASLTGPVHISMAKTTANVKIKRKKKIMNFTSPGRKRMAIMKIEKVKQRCNVTLASESNIVDYKARYLRL